MKTERCHARLSERRLSSIATVLAVLLGAMVFPSHVQADLDDNLMAHWTFDDGSGTTLTDVTGNGHTGTVYGGAAWVTGIGGTGYALQFDGSNDYVDVANPSSFGFANQSFTFTAWVKIEDNTNNYRLFVTIGDATDCYPLAELGKSRSGTSQGRIFMEVSPNGVLVYDALSNLDGNQLPKNEWIFAAGVVDWASAQIRLHLVYLDGVLHTTVDQVGSFNLAQASQLKVRLGAFPCLGGYHKGLLDEVRIYDRALSDAEVRELYGMCGDANSSGGDPAVDIDDVVYLINYVFAGGPEPLPLEAGDANCAGDPPIDIDDIVYLINYIFAGGPEPCAECK